MAYKKIVRESAREMYVVQGMPVTKIAEALHISLRTVMDWRKKEEWDNLIEQGGTVGLAMKAYSKYMEMLQNAIDNDELDPGTIDALNKFRIQIDKLMPKKTLLSNIYMFFNDIADYASTSIPDDDFRKGLEKYMPEMADHLRRKYAAEDGNQ